MTGYHGIELVECERYRMQLTPQSCASNWLAVEGKPMHTLTRLQQCSGCPVGAKRAGKDNTPAPLPRFCCRCLRLSPRLIGKRLCASCYNRERELKIGKNARGTAPIHATPVFPVSIAVNGRIVTLPAASRMEVAMVALRENIGAAIGWTGRRP